MNLFNSIILLFFVSYSYVISSTTSYIPLISIPTLFNYTNDVITTNGSFPITLTYLISSISYIIFDYGEDVGGFPFFDIDLINGNSSVRVSYSEALPNVIDGDIEFYPLIRSFDPYRVKFYSLTNDDYIESPLVQGAQRYQRLTLISGDNIRINKLAIKSAHHTKDISSSPRSFSCSSISYINMWKIGVRTLQINMIPPRTMPPGFIGTDQGFLLTPNQGGIYLRGM